MALSLSRPKDIAPPTQGDRSTPSPSLTLASQSLTVKIDAPTLLSAALEQWRDEHIILFQRQLEDRGIRLEPGPPALHLNLEGHLPDMETIDAALAMKRKVDITFIPNRIGDVTIQVQHQPSGEILSFSCDVRVTFREKEISETEMSMLKQSFQWRLVAQANAFFNRLVSDTDGDTTTSRPVFMVHPDPDLARLIWRPDEVSQKYKILKDTAAQEALTAAPEFTKPNARDAEASKYVVVLSPYVNVTPEYRQQMVTLARQAYRSQLSLVSRTSSLFLPQHQEEERLVKMVDTLLGLEISTQSAKDPSASAYEKRVGADPDSVRRRAAANREREAAKAQRLAEVRTDVRSTFAALLGNESLPQNIKNLLVNTQTSALAALSKGRNELAIESLNEAISRIPDAREHLQALQERLSE